MPKKKSDEDRFQKDLIQELNKLRQEIINLKKEKTQQNQSEERFRKMFDEVPLGMAIFDNNYKIINVNNNLCEMLGYSKQEFSMFTIFEIIIDNKDQKDKKFLLNVFEEKAFSGKSSRSLLKKNGDAICCMVTSTKIYDAEGDSMYGLCMFEDITEAMEAEIKLNNHIHHLSLSAEIGMLLTSENDLSSMLQLCCKAVVDHYGAAFSRIWTINNSNDALLLQASAGIYFHIDGKYSCITSDTDSKIWRILKEKKVLYSNKLIGDPNILDQNWVKKEGMVSFVGYPLMVSNRVLGVIAVFFKNTIKEDDFETMMSISQKIALGIIRKWSEEEQFRLNLKLRSLTGHLQKVQEREKKNLARELHDELGQFLTAISLELYNLKEVCNYSLKKEETSITNSVIDRISKLMETSMDITEKIIMNLRPVILDDLGLMASLKWLVSQIDKHSKIECKFETSIKTLDLNQDESIALYRIVQENINNISYHSEATKMTVLLKEYINEIKIIISDDGIGFKSSELVKPKSFGILGMKERAFLFGWKLKFESKIGIGTDVTLIIPKGDIHDKNSDS